MTPTPPRPDATDDADEAAVTARLAEALAPVLPDAAVQVALRRRLLARAAASSAAAREVVRVRADQGTWRELAHGVRLKVLHEDRRARSTLVDLAPGATLPAHRHHEHEECIVLRGAAQVGDTEVRHGDFHVAPAGSRHGRVRSAGGALLFLRGVPMGDALGVARDLIGALLPGHGQATTVRAQDGDWHAWLPAIDVKPLWDDGGAHSLMVRMQPGGCLPPSALALDEECLVIDGEIVLDDTLLRAGDYQRTPAGSARLAATTDVGALFYLRGPGREAGASRVPPLPPASGALPAA